MLEIKIKNLDNTIKETLFCKKRIETARIKSNVETGNQARKEIRDYIESSGNSSWRAPHPLASRFRKQKDGLWKRKNRPANFFELGKFSRFFEHSDKSGFNTGFSANTQRNNKSMLKHAQRMHYGQKTNITDKMRRKIAATNDIFIRKKTRQLVLPPRKIKVDIDKLKNNFVGRFRAWLN